MRPRISLEYLDMRKLMALVLITMLCAAILIYRHTMEARLLRADPDGLPANRSLMGYAAGPGRRQFQAHCASCHGVDGQGDTVHGIPDLRDGDWLYGAGSISEIERVVYYGIRSYHPKAWNLAAMPAYGTPHPSQTEPRIPPLNPPAIRDVIEFLFYLQGQPAQTAAAARGSAVFGNAGGCYDCHSPDGKGDPGIGAPNLTDRISLYGGSRTDLFDSIVQGRHGICPGWVNKLSPTAAREVAIYVYSLSHAQRPATVAARDAT